MSCRCLGLVVLFLTLAGCAHYVSFDSTAHLLEVQAERVPDQLLAHVQVPYELDEVVIAEVDTVVRPIGHERFRTERVIDFIFSRLDLRYSLLPTRNAIETFHAREGNCLSFVNLFVGVARHVRLNPFYVEVEDYQRWNYRDGVVLSRGHIVAGLNIEGELNTYDFLPYRPKAYRDFRPIDDAMAMAHYHNNLGAEALMRDDLVTARRELTIANAIAPDFEKAQSNLGIVHLRSGEAEEAVALYERAIQIHPDSVPLLNNLVRAKQQLGDQVATAELLGRLGEVNQTNPYFFIYQGEVALADGRVDEALEQMRRALRTDSEVPEVHLGLARVYLARGEMERARHHLGRALKLDATHTEARKMAAMLAPSSSSRP